VLANLGRRNGGGAVADSAERRSWSHSVSVRLLPCGAGHLESGFAGLLSGRKEYLQEERANLFSRYGQAPTPWTTVFQVAAVPAGRANDVENDSAGQVVDEAADGFSRAGMERQVAQLLGMMESVGIVEGPRWPTVSITPLGIELAPRTAAFNLAPDERTYSATSPKHDHGVGVR
jgi:hypothetical protein